MMGAENYLQTRSQREDYLHPQNCISSNTASFVPSHFAFIYSKENQEQWPLKTSMCSENEMLFACLQCWKNIVFCHLWLPAPTSHL